MCIRQNETCSTLCKQKYSIRGNAAQGEVLGANDAADILYIKFKKCVQEEHLSPETRSNIQ
jgi:hypothetical protein